MRKSNGRDAYRTIEREERAVREFEVHAYDGSGMPDPPYLVVSACPSKEAAFAAFRLLSGEAEKGLVRS